MTTRLIYSLVIIVMGLTAFSCKKTADETPEPPPVIEEQPDTLVYNWRVPVLDNGYTELTIQPQVFGDNLLYSNRVIFEDETLHMISTETKESVWSWHDYLGVEFSELGASDSKAYCLWNDLFIFTSGGRTTNAIDLNTGLTVWQSKLETGSTNRRITLFEDKIYTSHNSSSGITHKELHIVEIDAATGEMDTLYTHHEEEEDIIQGFKNFAATKNDAGEVILYSLHIRSLLSAPGTSGELKLMSFNANTGEKIFETESYATIGTTVKPVIFNGNVYFAAFNSFHCVDGATGETIWERELGQNDTFASTDWLVANGKIIAKSDHSKMFAFDAETGDIVWEIESGASCSYLEYYNGIVYFGCDVHGEIHAIDAETGEDYWDYKPPSNNWNYASFDTAMGIDREKGIVYACDNYYIYSIPAIR